MKNLFVLFALLIVVSNYKASTKTLTSFICDTGSTTGDTQLCGNISGTVFTSTSDAQARGVSQGATKFRWFALDQF